MALLKSIPTDFGINAEYWNIGAVQEDFKGRGTEVTFYGYANQQARQDGKRDCLLNAVAVHGVELCAQVDAASCTSVGSVRIRTVHVAPKCEKRSPIRRLESKSVP